MTLDLSLSSYIIVNSRWIKDLNVRPETINILEESLGNTLLDIGLGKEFMTRSSNANATQTKVDKLDLIKLKSFFTEKEIINRQHTEWKKIFSNYAYDKGQNELKQINKKKNPIKKCANIFQYKTSTWLKHI